MTEEQKKLIAIARESLDDLCHEVNTATNWLPTRRYKTAREKIERALNALEAGGKCKYRQYKTPYSTYQGECGQLFHGTKPKETWNYCPGCGREIEDVQ